VHDPNTVTTIPPLDRLIRAVGRGKYSETAKAYRVCYDTGKPLVSQIVEKIRAVNWKDLGPHERLPYFSCLMRLLHDIDESASRQLADGILSRGCHPVVAARLRSVLAFTLNDFEAARHGRLNIYVSKAIPRRKAMWGYLNTWLGHIPPEDLDGIHRLYVIEKARLPKLQGTYLEVLAVISLAWPSHQWNQFAVLQAELTLYHEVGHHVDRREFELTESCEAFADTYAERLFRKVHPKLGNRWLMLFLEPSHALRKFHRARRLTQADEQTDAVR